MQRQPVVVGDGSFRYEANPEWAQLPPGWGFGEVVGVAADSRDHVLVFSRSEHPVTVFDRTGRFVTSWGEGQFNRPHGIHIAPDDSVYLSDDNGHAVRKFDLDGHLLMTLGTPGKGSDTGVEKGDYRTIRQVAGPFNLPTNLATGPDGSLYVTDGYGNARVHKFTADGRLVSSWGEPGTGPGQFQLPHGIAVDSGSQVYVADRENSRVQIFDGTGRFLGAWTDVARPTEVYIRRGDSGDELVYVSEIGFRCGLFPGVVPPANPAGSCVSIWTVDGRRLARWGGGPDPCAAGDFFAAHDIWVDSRGDIYVSEVTLSAGGNRGAVPITCHTLQKFTRVSR